MVVKFLTFLSLMATFSLKAAPQEINKPWRNISDPIIMGKDFNRFFENLPLEGEHADDKKLWSGDYWANVRGNINYRWNSQPPRGFNLVSPSKEQVMKMTLEELALLAPSEKYDLFTGRYDYPLKTEVSQRASPRASIWEGICNGWATASLNHDEPTPIVAENPDGLMIPFGSSDLKALLSYYYAYINRAQTTHQVGLRCGRWPIGRDRCLDDINAGAFHIILANKLGIQSRSFIGDMEEGHEVWNHPIHSYKSTIIANDLPPAADSSRGTLKMVKVRSKVKYVSESERNHWSPVLGTSQQIYREKIYEYDLDLDKEGQIIGGDWKSSDRPDFLWLIEKTTHFQGQLSKLGLLIDDQVKNLAGR
jgi:hypothetical protein